MADDFSQRAARGQAYNLAILTAIADGKQHDNEYIVGQFLRHMAFAQLLQSSPVEQLNQIVKNPKLVSIIKELDTELRNL